MLRNVLESYIDTFIEREFDTPFLSLLLLEGFFDIHFIHGNYEFGKDFIAKNNEDGNIVQYIFQSKAGDISLSEWRELRYQIDEMRTNLLAHPNFNKDLARKTIVVTTGRFIGGASLSSQEYDRHCKENGELGFIVWDRDTLIEKFVNIETWATELNRSTDEFLVLIGSLRQNRMNLIDIERYSRNWNNICHDCNPKNYFRIILESALIIHELIKKERNAIACYSSLLPLRSFLYGLYNIEEIPDWARNCLELSKDMFLFCSHRISERVKISFLEAEALLKDHQGGTESFITYPLRCMQTMEILGLLGLLYYERKEYDKAKDLADVLELIIQGNPGCCHPISDRYAVSYIPTVILLMKYNKRNLCEELLKNTLVWICSTYERSDFGLAEPFANPSEEIQTLLGYAFDFYHLPKRRESYLSTVIMDLLSIIELPNIYEAGVNDLISVEAYPCFVEAKETRGQFLIDGDACFCLSINYKEQWVPVDGWKTATHHFSEPLKFFKLGYWWESLVIYSILRDRHRPMEIREIINF